MNQGPHILMLAAENDALPGGKVGGIGDVVRDIAPALAALGCTVTVLTPGYGFLAAVPGAQCLGPQAVDFGGSPHSVMLFEVPGRRPHPGVRHCVIEHPRFDAGGRIYCDDPPDAPFASDATRFALFCAAAGRAVLDGRFGRVDVLHLHDWHAAFLAILRRFHPAYGPLQGLRCVLSLHNLALQGVRPLGGHPSSLAAWYPGLGYEHGLLADPRWPECVNPLAAAIRLADAVHAVSPSYAHEIVEPSEVDSRGRYGGEGLEGDLRHAEAQGRLFGILNGCEYPDAPPPAPGWEQLLGCAHDCVLGWAAAAPGVPSAHFVAQARLAEWRARAQRPPLVLTSVGRVTDQKVRLLRQPGSDGRPALVALLDALGDAGVLLALGSGDPALEAWLTATSARHANFAFLRGYSDALSAQLYAGGDLFLMPSSFEPCGISQMLAMRAGQPCLVHAVGGLRDTVEDGVTGFAFSGDSPVQQADALVATLKRALDWHRDAARWQALRDAAAAARFGWEASARAYLTQLYRVTPAA